MLTSGRSDDTPLLVDRFKELTNDQWNRLNSLHFLLRPKKLSTQVLSFVTNVFLCPSAIITDKKDARITNLLQVQELLMRFQPLPGAVQLLIACW